MKSSDIIDQHFPVNNSEQIGTEMARQGYKRIGTGIDSTVYAKDAGNVIKILMPQTKNVRTAKFPFLSFYLYCRANPNNPYLPKFLEIDGKPFQDFVLNGQRFTQINMERLTPLKDRSSWRPILQSMSGNVTRKLDWQQTVDILSAVHGFKLFGIPRAEKLAEHWRGLMKKPEYKKILHDMYKTMEEMYAIGRRRGYDWDLHADNFLQRGETPVISDPWYNTMMRECIAG